MGIIYKEFNEKRDKNFIIKSLLDSGLENKEILFSEDRTFHMAYDNGNSRIGFLCIHDTGKQVCLKHFFIAESLRRKGFSKILIKKSIKEFLKLDYNYIIIDIKKEDPQDEEKKFKYLTTVMEKTLGKRFYNCNLDYDFYVVFKHEVPALLERIS